MIDVVHICVAMKPLDGNFAQNAIKHGVAGINIDGSRIAGKVPVCTGQGFRTGKYGGKIGHGDTTLDGQHWENTEGRFPANVILDGSDEVIGEFPNVHGAGHIRQKDVESHYNSSSYDMSGTRQMNRYGDEGSAARFFKQCEGDDE